MRIVAWNANHNGKRRSFAEALAMLEPLRPDIVVLAETAQPPAPDPDHTHWIGDGAPGLAVVALGGYRLEAHPLNESAPPLVAGFTVRGPHELNLLAAWPVQRARGAAYHQVLMAALDRYEGFLADPPAVLIGDLNTSARVTSQRRTHPAFVARAAELGLRSLYHEQSGEAQGEESTPTYHHQNRIQQPFHLDYCFASVDLLPGARFGVRSGREWWGRSDHYPIAVDLSSVMDAEDAAETDRDVSEEFIRAESGAEAVQVMVAVIDWDGPARPQMSWVVAETLPPEAAEADVRAAIDRVLADRRCFRRCRECGARKPVGWMHDARACQDCAQRWHGVVY